MTAAFLPVLGARLGLRRLSPALAPATSPARAARAAAPAMGLAAGDKLPLDGSVQTLADGGPAELALRDVFAGKKVVVFSVPGALTPTCTDSHGPEFVAAVAEFKKKGADAVACLCVNDPFVAGAYAKKMGAAGGEVTMLCDGAADLVKKIGIDMDTGAFGGVRAKRGSFIVDDGVFTHVNLEEGGGFTGPSSAKTVLDQL